MTINQKYFSSRNEELSHNSLQLTNNRHKKSIEIINHLLKINKLTTIDNNSNLLDVGSGDASLVKFLNSKSIKSNGCDINDADLEKDSLPYKTSSFSHVILYAVIEHIKNTNHLLSEIKRVLIKNGTLILITPNFRFCYDTFYDDPTHVKPFTDKSIYHLLTITNFEKISVKP